MVRLLVFSVLLCIALCVSPACDCERTGHQQAGAPRVETLAATNVGTASTTLNGTLADMEGYDTVRVWFYYWKESESGIHETPKQTITATGDFSAMVGPLTIGETYYFKAEGEGGGKSCVGGELNFTVH
jgi:hypothetical protein